MLQFVREWKAKRAAARLGVDREQVQRVVYDTADLLDVQIRGIASTTLSDLYRADDRRALGYVAGFNFTWTSRSLGGENAQQMALQGVFMRLSGSPGMGECIQDYTASLRNDKTFRTGFLEGVKDAENALAYSKPPTGLVAETQRKPYTE